MCYLIRQAQSEPERGAPAPGSGILPPRRRWVGAIAATLVGGLAVAALVAPPAKAPLPIVSDPAASVPIAAETATAPAGPVVEQTFVTIGDGVPADDRVVKGGGLDCSRDM
jgi:hypothetical protein